MRDLLEEPKARLSAPDTLLPEFYYDLLARILPGVVFLLGFLLLAGILDPGLAVQRLFTLAWAPAVLLVVAVGTCGYIIGILLTLFQALVRWFYIPGIWRPLLERHRRTICERQTELGLYALEDDLNPALPNLSGSAFQRAKGRLRTRAAVAELGRRIYSPLHDLLKDRHPQARLVLPKMNGEAGLCDNICGGLVVLSFILVVQEWLLGRLDQWALREIASLLLLAALFFRAARLRYDGLIRRHFAYWNLVPRATTHKHAEERRRRRTSGGS